MKTRYILEVITLLISIAIVLFYTYRWNEINSTINKLDSIKYETQEMIILDTKQKIEIKNLNKKLNYDEITSLNKKLNNATMRFIENLQETEDKTLEELAKKIQLKTNNLAYSYEDFKTDNAEIKNSIKWLGKNLKNYLTNPEKFVDIDKELLKKVLVILDESNDDISRDVYAYNKTSKNKIVQSIIDHLNILYIEYEHLHNAKITLDKNRIDNDLKNVSLHVEIILRELRAEVNIIIKFLLYSVIFLIAFSIFNYYKEVSLSLKIANLKNELQQFVDALNKSAIVSKSDISGKITYANSMFCEISGYSLDELIGRGHNILRNPSMSKDVFKKMWKTIQAKEIFRGVVKNRKKDGSDYYVDVVIIPILGIHGEIVEYLAVRYEITELVHARDKAMLAEKAKNEFLSNMSHELRTPLNSIKGFSDILSRIVKDEKQLKYLKHITDSSAHLIGLINDILDLSKLQSGKFSLDKHKFNPDKKIDVFLERFKAQLDANNVNMNVDLDKSLNITLNGDWLRISQIITNLISNAIKFTPSGKNIKVSAFYKDNKLNIIVSDEGIGLSKEAQEKIFEPFKQADNSTTRKYGGTGLGLSIVLSLVEQMNGEIKIDSTEGEGSRFEIILSIEKVDYVETQIKKALKLSKDKLSGHILVAEDNKTNQMLIRILLEEFGLSYETVDDGLQAIEKFDNDKFDVVLMDENMPNLNGTEAMIEIRKLHGNKVPIIVLTANAMSGDREKFLAAGMDGYISKPIDDEELYNMLKSFLNS